MFYIFETIDPHLLYILEEKCRTHIKTRQEEMPMTKTKVSITIGNDIRLHFALIRQ